MADNKQNPAPGNPPSKITPEQLSAALAVLQAAVNQPQQAEDTSAKEKSEAVERASKVDSIDLQIKGLQEKKKAECVVLLPLLHKHFGGRLTLANGTEVIAALSSEKRPTKKGIVAFLTEKLPEKGAQLAADFWKTVKGKTREYISCKRAGEAPTNADGEPIEPPTEE